MVPFNTQDSCAAKAMSPFRGSRAYEASPINLQYVSPVRWSTTVQIAFEGGKDIPRRAMSNVVLPDPLGPKIKLIPPSTNLSSSSMRRTKLDVGSGTSSLLSWSWSHANQAFRISIPDSSAGAEPPVSSVGEESSSSV